jgi:hypothetical protein
MDDNSTARQEPLSTEETKAKAAILAECENLSAAGIAFVAVHFDGYGDSGVTEELQCFDSEYYAYEEQKPVERDAAITRRAHTRYSDGPSIRTRMEQRKEVWRHGRGLPRDPQLV